MSHKHDVPEHPVSAVRSRNMAAIKGRDTTPELVVRRRLHAAGFRFRLHVKTLPGKPDIVLPKYQTVIEVNGCFWHYHGCRDSGIPKTRKEFWHAKLLANRARDAKNRRELERLGWRVETIWECELDDGITVGKVVSKLRRRRLRIVGS